MAHIQEQRRRRTLSAFEVRASTGPGSQAALGRSRRPSILVLALNPSIDAEWRVGRVRFEEKNEVLGERRWPGGKGVNVARWLRHLGRPARVILPLGGDTGRELARALQGEGLDASVVRLTTPTRVNVIVTPAEREGKQLRFNPVWLRLSLKEWRAIEKRIDAAMTSTRCVVMSGSLPRGAPKDAYARMIRRASRAGARSILDCDGEAFAAAVDASPFLVKPNEHELMQWARAGGGGRASERALLAAARRLSEATSGWVLVSRGARGGLLVNAAQGVALKAPAPRVRVLNTVGAGDALLAAVVDSIERGDPPAVWLQRGVATGSAAAGCFAGRLPQLPPDVGVPNRRPAEVTVV